MPSLTLLGQSILSGIFTGALYGLVGLGLSLSWGLLRLINLAHFALAFLGAYLTYTLASGFRVDPFVTLLVIAPAFFAIGVVFQALFARFGVTQFTSLLVTFGITVMRASAEDPHIAAAFGVNHRRLALLLSGIGAAYAGVAGAFIALIYTLAPAQIYAWVGVVFAAVILGGLGNPLGPLVAGVVIGVSEAVTMALTAPAWAPLVSFTLLILVLLLRPERV